MSGDPLISEFHEDPDMRELLIEFAASLSDSCERLRQSLAAGDKESVRRLAHQLKGSGGGYGYPQISDEGGCLEQAIRSTGTPMEEIELRIYRLIEVCERACAGIQTV